jgi:preprotein translocase subunit SecE
MLWQMYKKKQGQIIRWSSFAISSVLFVYGAVQLYKFLARYEWATTANRWLNFTIPYVDISVVLDPRLVISLSFLLASVWLFYFFSFQHNRFSDFLIDTESEMRKVSWPTMDQVVKSSIAVILIVFFLGLYLYVIDGILGFIFSRLWKI